jgi:hypothetical protein
VLNSATRPPFAVKQVAAPAGFEQVVQGWVERQRNPTKSADESGGSPALYSTCIFYFLLHLSGVWLPLVLGFAVLYPTYFTEFFSCLLCENHSPAFNDDAISFSFFPQTPLRGTIGLWFHTFLASQGFFLGQLLYGMPPQVFYPAFSGKHQPPDRLVSVYPAARWIDNSSAGRAI